MFGINIFNVFFTDLNFTNVSEAKPEKKNQYLLMSELPPRSLSYISERSSRPETRQEWAITQQFKHKHEVCRMKNTQSQSALTRYFCYVSFTWHPIDLYICKFILYWQQNKSMTPHQIAKQAAHDLEKRFPKVGWAMPFIYINIKKLKQLDLWMH